ncbi:MAG: PfaD family polyunsaturated fatty acid/polyketide biosynthesis protein [Desulfobacterales bacterium]|nr:PfaD family polyunsaturated fatty acid/polyketide biosynthesis protein [Desulfobacterales bacterium]
MSDYFTSMFWLPGKLPVETGEAAVTSALARFGRPVILVDDDGAAAVAKDGCLFMGDDGFPCGRDSAGRRLLAFCPPMTPEDLGSRSFKQTHGLRYAYVMGAMANGITSVEMVKAAGEAGMIGFFGAAGLAVADIEAAVHRLKELDAPFGVNLIHSPYEPDLEAATVELYLKHGVRLVSASAYLGMTLPLVRYRLKGIARDPEGNVVCRNRIVAKVSRQEVARKFLSPAPEKLLRELVSSGELTEEQARMAESVPMAGDMTAEADSGGHTDNRPAITLLPTMLALRDDLHRRYRYRRVPCVGLGGGIATPGAAAAAFAMGADFVLTGTVNQACREAGTSDAVRRMLVEAEQADVTMAPAADMFEMGVKVQVLKRGTMFPQRAARLYELFRGYPSLEALPEADRKMLERDYFRCSLDEVWHETCRFFQQRDPNQIRRGEANPRHRMALVFRSYLGRSSGWANAGDPTRQIDYQIWCGPAIGAFNRWCAGTFLEKPENRTVVAVAMNLLAGACVAARAAWLRSQGAPIPAGAGRFRPIPLERLMERIYGTSLAN